MVSGWGDVDVHAAEPQICNCMHDIRFHRLHCILCNCARYIAWGTE